MADVVGTFKKFPLSLQLILAGAVVFVIGSFLDLYSGGGGNLLDYTTGFVALGAMVVGAVLAYMKKMALWSLVLIVLATGAVLFLFLQTILDGEMLPSAGIGLFLLTIGSLAASWGAIQAESK